MSLGDDLRRSYLPRTVVALSTVRAHRHASAAVRRALGGAAELRLFVAYDDAASALAVLALADLVADRRVDLRVEAVVERGIPGDPAAAAKRSYAVRDAGRLARRHGLELTRTTPVAPGDVAFLAAWTAALADGPERTGFCRAAMRELWCGDPAAPLTRERFAPLFPGKPPAGDARRAERSMRRRGLYDTPVAVLAGEWFFAHERVATIAERLDELGWRAAA